MYKESRKRNKDFRIWGDVDICKICCYFLICGQRGQHVNFRLQLLTGRGNDYIIDQEQGFKASIWDLVVVQICLYYFTKCNNLNCTNVNTVESLLTGNNETSTVPGRRFCRIIDYISKTCLFTFLYAICRNCSMQSSLVVLFYLPVIVK